MSETLCSAKNFAPIFFAVDSHATALAPFSQNSNELVCLGSGQAQLGQSKPCGWFDFSSVCAPLVTICYALSETATAFSAPHPPAGPV